VVSLHNASNSTQRDPSMRRFLISMVSITMLFFIGPNDEPFRLMSFSFHIPLESKAWTLGSSDPCPIQIDEAIRLVEKEFSKEEGYTYRYAAAMIPQEVIEQNGERHYFDYNTCYYWVVQVWPLEPGARIESEPLLFAVLLNGKVYEVSHKYALVPTKKSTER